MVWNSYAHAWGGFHNRSVILPGNYRLFRKQGHRAIHKSQRAHDAHGKTILDAYVLVKSPTLDRNKVADNAGMNVSKLDIKAAKQTLQSSSCQ